MNLRNLIGENDGSDIYKVFKISRNIKKTNNICKGKIKKKEN
jgi:hypothetical protein